MNNCKLIPIRSGRNAGADKSLQKARIINQLQKILDHRLFTGSDILSRFLIYIIQETLSGRTNQIKEYTIAIDVLHKPADFTPGNDCIVRIHARRLRNYLKTYYNDTGQQDDLIISIPKGRYIPSFQPRTHSLEPEPVKSYDYFLAKEIPETIILAVIPFKTFERQIPRLAFTDSIGQIICNELDKLPKIELVSYHVMRLLSPGQMNMKSLASDLGVSYVLTGVVQFEGNRIKVFTQLIDALTRAQAWSEIYQVNLNHANYFEISDYVASKITNAMGHLNIGTRHERFQHIPAGKAETVKITPSRILKAETKMS